MTGWSKALFGCLLCSSNSNNESSPANHRQPAVLETAAAARGGTAAADDVISIDAPELTVRELNEATAKFSAARLVGEGKHKHAKVYRASLRSGTAAAAAKVLVPPGTGGGAWSPPNLAFMRPRLAAASRLRHPNVARLVGYTVTADLRVLHYELADLGTLHDALHGPTRTEPAAEQPSPPPASPRVLSWAQRVRIALDAARGLAYLHDAAAVTHREVRSSKVLLFPGFRAKIAGHDVFYRQPDPDEERHNVQIPLSVSGYRPPEYCMERNLMTREFDVFSFGVVLVELLTGRNPARGIQQEDRGALPFWSWTTPLLAEGRVEEMIIDPKLGDQYPRAGALQLARIAVQCLQHRPASRPSMATVARWISSEVMARDHQHGVV